MYTVIKIEDRTQYLAVLQSLADWWQDGTRHTQRVNVRGVNGRLTSRHLQVRRAT